MKEFNTFISFKEEAAAKLKLLQESGIGTVPSLNNHIDGMKRATHEDDEIDDDIDEDLDRDDSDPEEHPEDHELIKDELKRETLGDFKSPFNMINPSSTAGATMSSIISPFFTSLAAQANSTGSSRFFSPSELFNSVEASKSASTSSGSSLVRPSPPSSPLKPTAFNLNSLGHGNNQKLHNKYIL